MRKPTVHPIAVALAAVGIATALGGCAGESTAPPVSTAFEKPRNQALQSANSLPRGSAVSAPILPEDDGLATTPVDPSRAGNAARIR